MTSKRRLHLFIEATVHLCGAARSIAPACLTVLLGGTLLWAEDWPTYRHDAARSGVTSEEVAVPLQESWVFQSRHLPQPAWADPRPEPVEDILELRRVHFDDVMQPVVADGAVYFGSSADNKVYCLDAATGQIRWTRITGGPIRLAPMVAGGRVYFGSDDGYAYCLDAKDGSLVWKYHAAPEDRRVLGHRKMISLWPLRTGILVDDGVAYFTAGIFPAEGVFLFALDAASGRVVWRNDACGESPQSRISPQGYLLSSQTSLYVPMGRVSPAAFDRRDGRLKRETFFGKTVGGTYSLLADQHVYTGTEEILAYNKESHDKFATFAGRKMIVSGDTAYLASNTELTALDRTKDPKDVSIRWKTPCQCPDSLILAGKVLFAGGAGHVVAVDAANGKEIWRAQVEGTAKGLAACDGRLLASTDRGRIYCFAPQGTPQHGPVTEPTRADPFADAPAAEMFRNAAGRILDETGIRRGYCLVLGLETGQLAFELARQSELMVYAVSPDEAKVAAARKALDEAGLYGTRVCVDQWPPGEVPYSDYFANLIVSETAMLTGELPENPGEVFRMLKPLGGTAMIGQPAERAGSSGALDPDAVGDWLKRAKLEGGKLIANGGTWAKITRGALPGAGSWTHQYANPGNTACGDDLRVKAPLGVLWFGRPGPDKMVQRHSRAAGPLSIDGRLFVEGENTVMAYDAYNGLKLWQRDIPGAIRTTASHDSSNLALSRDGLFVAVGDRCLRLDLATGETKATYQVPGAADGKPRRWGYVACVGNMLLGSRTANMRLSECIFALDVETGELRWVYEGKQIPHNSIAVGDGQVFLVSADVTEQQREEVIKQRLEKLRQLSEAERAKAEADPAKIDVRLVVGLDAQTGKPRWQRPVDLTNCGGWHVALKKHSAILASMYNRGVLVLFGVYLDGHYWEQFFAKGFDSRRIVALSGKDGATLWSQKIGFRVRPLIVEDTLYAEPWAFDLHSGQPKMRVHPVTGKTDRWQFARPGHHCGCPCASPNCLFFRSYTLGYYDLLGDYGTMHFGAQRPGCWINFIPAAGLLLMPEASAGCMCPFPNMCSIVFQPTEQAKGFAMYSAAGPTTPVERLAINLGGPGDRKDSAGTLWLGYPRPFDGRLVLPLQIDTTFYQGGAFVRGNSTYSPVEGTPDPWLFASAAKGLKKCVIPLGGGADGAARYRVRLAFADPENGTPGQRVFDVKLQGKLVQEDLDVVGATGGRHRALVKEYDGIEAGDQLVIELVSKVDKPAASQLPILQAVEIAR